MAQDPAPVDARGLTERDPPGGSGCLEQIGRLPETGHTLDLSKLSGVTLYEPAELVLSAKAGTPLAEIEKLLAENGQQLAFEPMDYGPLFGETSGRGTIGGVLAANISGPRRLKAGAARDHILGIHAVSGRGEAFKSGGRVVKNVTGYDLSKAMAGSWGTLAVVTDVTFKVLPAAETETTLNADRGGLYGPLKAASEREAERCFPGRTTILRPTLIVGPGDETDRFTYWPVRLARGGEVLCPGDGEDPVQFIDARDLAEWSVRMAETPRPGVYNALGPTEPITMKQVVDACNEAGGNHATVTWVDAAFLEKQEVHGWSDMPLWIDNKGDFAGFGTLANARAVAKGLTFRPIGETAKDTLAWLATLPEDKRARFASSGISREKESKVLAAWKAAGPRPL